MDLLVNQGARELRVIHKTGYLIRPKKTAGLQTPHFPPRFAHDVRARRQAGRQDRFAVAADLVRPDWLIRLPR